MSAPSPVRLLARTVRALLLTVRGVLAAAVAALLLVGLPYGLIRFIGWPLPHRVPSLTQLRIDVTSPILGDQVYLNAIAIVIWLLWLLITVSFALETVALLRGVEIPPIPGLRPTQALAVVLLTAIGITTLMARTAAPAQAAATNAARVPTRAPAAATAPVSPGTGPSTDAAAAASSGPADATGPSPTHPAETMHTVAPGDNLFDIARADYGNGEDWRLLYSYNAGVTQADGQKLTNPDLIRPGWVLHTTDPAAASRSTDPTTPHSAPTSSAPAPSQSTTVAPHYTTPAQAPTAPATTRPSAHPGPERPSASSPPTLQRTADPPAPVHHRTAPFTGPDWVELAEGGALAAGVLAALGLALRRSRRLRRWYGTCYWPTPGQAPTSTATIPIRLRPVPHRTTDTDLADRSELDQFGAPADPDTGSIETTGDHDVAQHPEEAPTTGQLAPLREPADAGAILADDQHEPGPARIAVATTNGRTLTLQDLAPAIALTGPGALGAARAAAAGVLSAAWHRHDGARLLISRQDAALLLERPEADLPARLDTIPDLELAERSADTLAHLEEYIAYRTRLLEENQVTALEQTPDYDLDYFPPIVLLAVARPELASRLGATLRAGTDLRAHAVLLGELPGTPTWHATLDGRLSGPTVPGDARMFHLSANALADALALLEDATGDTLRAGGPPTAPDPSGELADPHRQPDLDHATDTDTAQAHPDADKHELETGTARPPLPRPQPEPPSSTEAPAPAAAEQGPSEHATVPVRASTGPLLLTQAPEPDQVAQITEQYAGRPVRIKVLGVRAITTPTGTIDAKLRADAWRAAMKLATAGRHSQHTDDFAALWPDQDDHALRVTVKNAVYDLRKSLRQRCGDPGNNPHRYITQANRRYALNEHTVGVDLTTFDKLRTLAARTRDIAQRTAAATAALDLYDGDLLSGEDEEWMIAPRAKARRDALATATLLAQLADQNGDPEAALGWWERALQIDDNEEVYRQIIAAQGRLGRRADALATRDLLVTRLDADGLSPAPETLAVLADVLSRRPNPSSLVASADS